jgi:iron uptake system component EfeO
MCAAIAGGNLAQAEQLYPQARIFYERIEPVAEVWGTLDASIDARANDVAKPSDLQGFHKLEQLMWADTTLNGAPTVCSALVTNEQRLLTLVSKASYDPVTMATGATDLINEAATSKITGEEERYSNTDFVVFQANVDGAMEVVDLLKPALQHHGAGLVTQIQARYQKVESALAPYQATPGYDDTGYAEYSAVLTGQRRAISAPVQAFAESLSKMSGQLG